MLSRRPIWLSTVDCILNADTSPLASPAAFSADSLVALMAACSNPRSNDALRDPRRLAAVARTGLLDTPPEEEFDRLARAAALALDAPLAFVTIVDDRRSYWKSSIGLDVPEIEERQLPVQESLCHYGVSTGSDLFVADTRQDERTRDSTPVKAMGVLAWASVPIRAPAGEVVGSFCVGDLRTREWSENEIAILEALAEATTGEVALRERAAQAMSLARTMQQSLVPPSLPELPGFVLVADYRAADDGTKLVGDFFDVFESQRDCWNVLIGDVAGHGPEAAMIAARMRYAVRSAAAGCTGPGEILAHMNQALLSIGPERRLSTMALANIHADGTLRIAAAGHPPPVLRRAGVPAESLKTRGPLLGAFPFTAEEVREVEVSLAPGDALILYTDGITDAGRGRALGERGLLETIDRAVDLDPERLVDHLQNVAASRAGGTSTDDAAVLLLQRA